MRKYTVRRTTEAPPLAGDVADTPWRAAEIASIDNWPWYQGGQKQPTEVRLLFDAEAIYVQFQCIDKHIYSRVTELNGPVYEDSCVEFFAATDPDAAGGYFNFEANCCGVFHLGFGPGRDGRKLITPELASRIEIVSSEPGPTRDESPDDGSWWLAVKLPFDVLGEFTGTPAAGRAGDAWRANFYRCGGKTDGQYACWNPIAAARPDFHRPECFGRLRFA